jgi:hypothetical protein
MIYRTHNGGDTSDTVHMDPILKAKIGSMKWLHISAANVDEHKC